MANKDNTLTILFSILGVLSLILLVGAWLSEPNVESVHNNLAEKAKLFGKQLIEREKKWFGLSLEETKNKKNKFIQDITDPRSIEEWTNALLLKWEQQKPKQLFGIGILSLVFFILAFVDISKKWKNFNGWSSFFIICLAGFLLFYFFINLTVNFINVADDYAKDISFLINKYELAKYKNYQDRYQYMLEKLKEFVQGKKNKEEIISEFKDKNIAHKAYEEAFKNFSVSKEGINPEEDKKKKLKVIEEDYKEDMSFEEWMKGKEITIS